MNILLIITDQQAADAMSCTGNPCLHTPNMDRIARNGVRFEHACTTYPLCTPARAAIFSGRLPHEVGCNRNEEGIAESFREQELGNVLKTAGYDCGYGGKWHVPEYNSIGPEHGFKNISPCDDPRLAERCVAFLKRPRETPFFLVASFDNPHNICEWDRDQYMPGGGLSEPPLPADLPNLPPNFAPDPHECSTIRTHRFRYQNIVNMMAMASPEDFCRRRWAYFRLVEKVDAEIGKLLDGLDEAGHADDTLIVFMSDHGDQNGAHALTHKLVLYEESVRVPFIVSGPGLLRDTTNHEAIINNGPDLYATLLDFAGAAAPEDVSGLSLRPVLEGRRDTPGEREYIVAETILDNVHMRYIRGRMVRSRRYKYTCFERGKRCEALYDMENDPGEMVNLAVERRFADELNRHRRYLREHCIRTGDRFGDHYVNRKARPVNIPGLDTD